MYLGTQSLCFWSSKWSITQHSLLFCMENPWKRVSEQVKLPSSSDHWFDQIVVLEKNAFNSPMCDDKVLVSEIPVNQAHHYVLE